MVLFFVEKFEVILQSFFLINIRAIIFLSVEILLLFEILAVIIQLQ